MEKQDLEQIKTIVSQAVEKGVDEGNEKMAQMVAKGFAHQDKRTDGVERQLTSIDGKLTVVEEKLINVDERLTIVERKLDKALYREFQRIDELEKDMKQVKQKLGLAQ
ncbi:MAG: hypothetical protein U1C57_01610 [Candidatus Doudnabacteria bacterium]|nr:hypothetical protein [bacterium]MDZ4243780.1 hypothetical protein [Candidatus Doudnabacteria bacterium]